MYYRLLVISCAMKDIVCPPSTIFAVHNTINSEKDIEIMEFYDHSWEAHIRFEEKKLEYLKKYLWIYF